MVCLTKILWSNRNSHIKYTFIVVDNIYREPQSASNVKSSIPTFTSFAFRGSPYSVVFVFVYPHQCRSCMNVYCGPWHFGMANRLEFTATHFRWYAERVLCK